MIFFNQTTQIRRFVTVIIISAVLTACTTNSSKTVSSKEVKTTDTHSDIKAVLNGDWAERSYIDVLAKTKSPSKSKGALRAIVELNIDTAKISGDSLEIGAPSIHEGTSFYIFFRPGITVNALPTSLRDYDNNSNFYELGYLISNKDTSVVIYHYDKDKKLINKDTYRKVLKNSEGPLQYMVNKTLVAGVYKTTDTTGQLITMLLTDDGKVIGFPNFSKYYVLTDFVAGPDSLDEICFDIQTKNQRCYAFEIKADTINLYQTIENTDSAPSSLGKRMYRLVKK